MKKTIMVDFDGVLNEYKGNFDENNLPEIKTGAKEFLKTLSEKFEIKIFTTRPVNKIKEWIIKYELNCVDGVTNTKEPAYLYIDDRCIRFDGDYNDVLAQIEKFKVWYK